MGFDSTKIILFQLFLKAFANKIGFQPTSFNDFNELEDYLREFLQYSDKKKYYKVFGIKKRSGKFRLICAPIPQLKEIQQLIAKKLYQILSEPHPSVHGYALGRNIVTNASQHIGKKIVLNLDIKDFFPSITKNMIIEILSTQIGFEGSIGLTATELCTLEDRLPQGSPASPILSNLACRKLDDDLSEIATEFNFTYTRYADDITFSNDDEIVADEFIKKIRQAIVKYGFEVNESKFRIRKNGRRQEVTGLTVNKILNVRRSYLKNIRAILHNWEKLGADYIVDGYWEKYDKSRSAKCFVHSLRGKIEYVGMVRGKDDMTYLLFLDKFYFLLDRENFLHTHKFRPFNYSNRRKETSKKDLYNFMDDENED